MPRFWSFKGLYGYTAALVRTKVITLVGSLPWRLKPTESTKRIGTEAPFVWVEYSYHEKAEPRVL